MSNSSEGNDNHDVDNSIYSSMENDRGFDGYIETTIHPGSSILIGTVIFCVASQLALPFLVAFGNKRARLRRDKKRANEERFDREGGGDGGLAATEGEVGDFCCDDSFEDKFEKFERRCHDLYCLDHINEVVMCGCCCCTAYDGETISDEVEKCNQRSGEEILCYRNMESRLEVLEADGLTLDGGDSMHSKMEVSQDESSHEIFQEEVSQETSQKDTSRDESDTRLPSRKSNRPLNVEMPASNCKAEFLAASSDEKQPHHSANNSFLLRTEDKPKKKRHKRIIRAITKSVDIHPHSSSISYKTTPLDGGFFGQRKQRKHHHVTESQIKREEKREKKREERKREKLGTVFNVSMQYEPPPTESISVNIARQDSLDLEDVIACDEMMDCFCENDDVDVEVDDIESLGCQSSSALGTSLDDAEHSVFDFCISIKACRTIFNIAKFDNESRRVVCLMLPLTISALVVKILEGIDIILISWWLGTDALAAYVVAGFFLGLTSETLKGFTDAESSLCSHAIGAGNFSLAGQYIQLSQIAFVLVGIPFVFMCCFFTYDALLLLDMSRNVARLGQQWASTAVVACVLNGVNESLFQFLSVIDTDIYSTVIGVMMSVVQTSSFAITLHGNEDATLVDLALIKLEVVFLFIAINIIFLTWKGWLDLFWDGMVKMNALKNQVAVKQLLKTGIPLALGSVIREGQWGVLVTLASFMGPAEVATWAILRTFWDIFAASMEGVCCAAEIRCAYHIGKGNLAMAKVSSYKSLIIGILLGLVLTVLLFVWKEEIVDWFTRDSTLQNMISEVLPLVYVVNINMSLGMLCWSLIGAQGRYRLATFVSFFTGWLVTVPLGAIFVYGLNLDLQGLVSAVCIGHSVSGTILMYLLARSNWKKRIAKVLQLTSVCQEDPPVCREASECQDLSVTTKLDDESHRAKPLT